MKILIVAATDFELEKDKFSAHEILITGVGILETSLELTKKLVLNRYDLVINAGIAGSFDNKIKIGDVVEVTEDVLSELGYEDNKTFFEFKSFSVPNKFTVDSKTDLLKVKSITVNTVSGNTSTIKKIKKRLSPDIETMEGAAVFRVCNDFNIPCMQIRSVSNFVGERNKKNWNIDLAIKNLNLSLKKVIISL